MQSLRRINFHMLFCTTAKEMKITRSKDCLELRRGDLGASKISRCTNALR